MQIDYARLGGAFPQPYSRVYLMSGTDEGLKNEAVHRLLSQLDGPASAESDREEIDVPHSAAGESLARTILGAASGVPMFCERRVVVATNIQRLTKEDQDLLAEGLKGLSDFTCIVLVAGTPEFDSGRLKARSVASPALLKAVDGLGAVVTCNTPDESALVSRAGEIVKAAGKTIAPQALERIVHQAKAAASDRGGGGKQGDFNVLRSELEKSILYVGERKQITEEDVRKVCGRAAIDNVFALTDAVGQRNLPRALFALEELFRTGERPDRIAPRALVMLARQIRLIWGVLAMSQGGKDHDSYLSSEVSGLASRQGYLLRSLQEQSRRWTVPELDRAQRKILSYDLEMKGIFVDESLGEEAPAGDDPSSLLKALVIELCGAKKDAARVRSTR